MEQFNNYFLNTKATRSEYWYFVLFYIIISIILSMIDTYIVNPMIGMNTTDAAKGGILLSLNKL